MTIRLAFILLLSFFLSACGYNHRSNVNPSMMQETWPTQVENDPRSWAYGASPWFLTGMAQVQATSAAGTPASKLSIALPDFQEIYINGAFRVEIDGAAAAGVEMIGPDQAVRQAFAQVKNGRLYLTEKNGGNHLAAVTIRVGVRGLQKLIQAGCGQIEAIHIDSKMLDIETTPTSSGVIYLAGYADIRHIYHAGNGAMNIFGAQSTGVNITTLNRGDVNVSGKIALNCIVHHGASRIRVIGASALTETSILADGNGCVTINGDVNLQDVNVAGNVGVYAYMLRSNHLKLQINGRAEVGLAGSAKTVYANLQSQSKLFARNLCANVVYIRTHGASHANIYAINRIFAAATGSSTIYFYGVPEILSQFVSGNSNIIPVWDRAYPHCKMIAVKHYKGEQRNVRDVKGVQASPIRHKHHLHRHR